METFDAESETGITEKEGIDDFINQQESANTNKRTVTETDMNTLLRCMEANGMNEWENWKLTSVRAWLPFVEYFYESTQEKRRRI